VRSLDEVLATLDAEGKLDGVPFMPEMAAYCGQRFMFGRTANRVCDEGAGQLRRLEDAVFLKDLRCDGSAHDGCQRGCLVLWKKAWLKQPGQPASLAPVAGSPVISSLSDLKTKVDGRYYCQSTELTSATQPMSRWDVRPLIADLRNGESSLRRFVQVIVLTLFNKLSSLLTGRSLSVLIGHAKRTSPGDLDLKTGESVTVKSREEILSNLTEEGRNQGLSFEYEMLGHCGGDYEVAFPIRKIILEESGQMIEISNTVALEGVVCSGLLLRDCPRANYLYWREAWLERCADEGRSAFEGGAHDDHHG